MGMWAGNFEISSCSFCFLFIRLFYGGETLEVVKDDDDEDDGRMSCGRPLLNPCRFKYLTMAFLYSMGRPLRENSTELYMEECNCEINGDPL